MAQFLSKDWFEEVERLNDAAGDLNLPPNLAAVTLNAKILGDSAHELHLKEGKIHAGLLDNAISTITIDSETLYQIINTGDVNIAIEAFMLGKIRIDGDMTQVMTLQSAKPSQEQKALYKQIKAMSEF